MLCALQLVFVTHGSKVWKGKPGVVVSNVLFFLGRGGGGGGVGYGKKLEQLGRITQ